MTDGFDPGTLTWLKAEIDETLGHARSALEAYVEEPQDDTRLHFCLNYLHQVQGTLQMVELYGAALLAEEMEALVQALLDKAVPQPEDAYEGVMRGILQLPDYLERIEAGAGDVPLILLPLLNDLRAARGAPLLSENALFSPDLSVAAPAMQPPAGDIVALTRQLRHAYHKGLLGLFRDQDAPGSLERIAAVLEQLRDAAQTPTVRQLLWVAGGVVEALREEGLEAGVAVKRLLGQVDRQFKRLLDGGEAAVDADPPRELLKNLLYYVARSTSAGSRVTELAEAFELAKLLPDDRQLEQARASLAGPNAALLNTVATAILEDLTRVKDGLDVFVRSAGRNSADLTPLADSLAQSADTLGMLGMGIARRTVQEQVDALRAIAAGTQAADDATLLQVAGALLSVETALQDVAAGRKEDREARESEPSPVDSADPDYRQVVKSALREARGELAHVKDALSAFSLSPTERELLNDIPEQLHRVHGGLALLNMNRAAALLQVCSDYVAGELIAQPRGVPQVDALETLADALSSIEYFLEASVGGWGNPAAILDLAEQSLVHLGLQVGEEGIELGGVAEEIQITDVPVAADPTLSPLQEIDLAPVEPGGPEPDMAAGTEVPGARLGEALDLWLMDPRDAGATELLLAVIDGIGSAGAEAERDRLAKIAADMRSIVAHISAGGDTLSEDVFNTLHWARETVERLLSGADHGADAPGVPDAAVDRAPHPGSPPAMGPGASPAAPARRVDAEIDDEIIAIFIEEAGEELRNIGERLPRFQAEPEDLDNLREVRRAFHTLKGSGRLVGAADIGEFAWALENMLNRVLDHTIEPSPAMHDLLARAPQVLSTLIELFRTGATPGPDVLACVEAAHALSQGREPAPPPTDAEGPAQDAIGLVEVHDAPGETVPDEAPAAEPPPATARDEVLTEIYLKEARGHLEDLVDFLAECEGKGTACTAEHRLVRALHTLHGSSRTAGVPLIAALYGPLEKYAKLLAAKALSVDEPARALLRDGIELTARMLSALDETDEFADEHAALVERTQGLTDAAQARSAPSPAAPGPSPGEPSPARDYDEELLEIFLEEGAEILDASDHTLQQWRVEPDNAALLEALQRELHTLKGGARMAGVMELGDLSHSVESLLTALADGRVAVSGRVFDLLQQAHDRLAQMLERVRDHQGLAPAQDLIARVEEFSAGWAEDEPADDGFGFPDGQYEAPDAGVFADLPVHLELAEEPLVQTGGEGEMSAADAATGDGHGAREDEPDLSAPPEPVPVQETEAPAADPPPEPSVHASQSQESQSPPAADVTGVEEARDRRSGSRLQQEQVRVRADLLDSLVNFAGEVSIYRSRAEQQINSFNYNLLEMDETVARLREQLRKFEIETEAQIQYRIEETGGTSYQDFDPLELDRFTQMQQLSRGMLESLSDLDSIRGMLQNLAREAETVLVQQSRVNTELQEGLMRTRMVPFTGHAPRLRRIVRQVSQELGKQAELQIVGAETELDRTVLDRILAPIEHMLRNALAHGIERPAEREAAGKPAMGTITLAIGREGSEAVIRVSDDGGGVNLQAVSAKAVSRGLIAPGVQPTKDMLLGLLMESGFSTAETVTQIAGRGVGMDVVSSEIKQLGGTLVLDSEPGQGTTFTVRLPLTLSISRALMVMVDDTPYAVPLLSVEGIERVSHEDLEQLYSQGVFTRRGEDYRLMHLGRLMGHGEPSLPGPGRKAPLLLARSGEYRAALHVEGLLGSREVVVKSVGPQLSTLRGISGATIMGDGTVVMIVDLGVLVRHGLARTAQSQRPAAEFLPAGPERVPTVMIVDDSITVRKVTARLLERHNMNVLTAKDGVDALAVLQDHVPDLMLLDIEMPRMDGFELATNVRKDARLANIPIIMITSRTGDKHRERALNLGVNKYLGKPYQEGELLESIHALLQGADEGLLV